MIFPDHVLERSRTAFGTAYLTVDLRPDLRLLAPGENIEDHDGLVIIQILIIIVVDLNHGRIGAGTEAFDLSKRKKTIGCRPALDQSLVLTGSEHIVRTAQHTGRRAANLYMIADRKSVVSGKSVSVRVDLGGRRYSKKKNKQ